MSECISISRRHYLKHVRSQLAFALTTVNTRLRWAALVILCLHFAYTTPSYPSRTVRDTYQASRLGQLAGYQRAEGIAQTHELGIRPSRPENVRQLGLIIRCIVL
ncbi:hypothetical protein PM082_021290 [Marasmius tenuissimus]|nr:hypothetical protein PM082_021290 [Marasmius tenuissimus]